MHSKRSSPSASLLNSIKGPERSLEKVPAVQWGRWKEDDAKQDYLHEMRAHKDIKIKSCGLNIPAGKYVQWWKLLLEEMFLADLIFKKKKNIDKKACDCTQFHCTQSRFTQ